MSKSKLLNMIRLQSTIANNARTMTDLGIVTGYDSQNYLVTVEIYPEDEASNTPALNTGWIPLFSPWIGNGWGLFLPPNIGDIIEVHYQSGSLQNAYAALRSYNYGALPMNVSSGEFWLVHQTGSIIKLTNDGKITINANVELDLIAPVVNITSPEVNLGNGTLSAVLNEAAAAAYNSHTHTGSFSGPTSTPTPQLTSADQTTNVMAS